MASGAYWPLLVARECGLGACYEPEKRLRCREPLGTWTSSTCLARQQRIGANRAWVLRLALSGIWDSHTGCVNTLCWNDAGTLCLSGSDDTRIKIWDCRSRHWNAPAPKAGAAKPTVRRRRQQLRRRSTRTDDDDAPSTIWDEPRDYEDVLSWEDHGDGPPCAPHQHRQRPLFSFLSGHTANIFDVKFLPESADRIIVSCAGDHQIRISDLESQRIRAISCHTGRVKKLATIPSMPNVFLSASEDGTVRQFDLREPLPDAASTGADHAAPPSVHAPTRIARKVLLDLNTPELQRARAGFPLRYAFVPGMAELEAVLNPQVTLRIAPFFPSARMELYSLKLHPLDHMRFLVAGTDETVRLYDRRMVRAAHEPLCTYAPQRIAEHAERMRRRRREAMAAQRRAQEREWRRGRRTSRRTVATRSRRGSSVSVDSEEGAHAVAAAAAAATPNVPMEEEQDISGEPHESEDYYENISITDVQFSGDGAQFLATYSYDSIYLFDTEPNRGSAKATTEGRRRRDRDGGDDAVRSALRPVRRGDGGEDGAGGLTASESAPPAEPEATSTAAARPTARSRGTPSPPPPPPPLATATASAAWPVRRPSTVAADSETARAAPQPPLQPMTISTMSEHSEVSTSRMLRATDSVTGVHPLPRESVRALGTSAAPPPAPLPGLSSAASAPTAAATQWTSPRSSHAWPMSTAPAAAAAADTDSVAVSHASPRPPPAGSGEPTLRQPAEPSAVERSARRPGRRRSVSGSRSRPPVHAILDSDDDDSESADAQTSAPDAPGGVPRQWTTATCPNGSFVRSYMGHRNVVTVKEVNFFGPGDEYVISGSDDGRVYIWDRYTGELLQCFQADRHVVNCVETHPHEPYLATAGIDSTIKWWRPEAPAPRRLRDLASSVSHSREYLHQLSEQEQVLPREWMHVIHLLHDAREAFTENAPGPSPMDESDGEMSSSSGSDDDAEEQEPEQYGEHGSESDEGAEADEPLEAETVGGEEGGEDDGAATRGRPRGLAEAAARWQRAPRPDTATGGGGGALAQADVCRIT
ncbi:hypothetical protein CDCA_CDCA08G2442 [Cyanidium caldarium]|uniref:Uncharacterized protein n=1 Tax=Cyanidium caldarium TaxID=2771 RepID=A0AAV9IVQ4_CYACA|nr:hypothetical protein CDCA_CDCA08G2442 [Cyanidium caldarium]